eukprot:TRINITY_DN21177_c0_g1_i1.p1 TRINITY_DN21177_c0_g1~~TRINITY_DN21177_c0_g1_i1.p1  ORF type:complete len:249 (+),score=51.81 TRINITY_DN21177_c0_g1_i1:60-749(+)
MDQRPRMSLLDVVLNKQNVDLEKENPILSRAVMAGAVTSGESCKGFFETLVGGEGQGNITGVLVEAPKNFLHLVEGTTKDVLTYCKCVNATLEEYDAIHHVVVAAYTDDIQQRAFSKWTSAEQQVQGAKKTTTNRDALKTSIVDIIYKLTELGSLLHHKEKLQVLQILSGLKSSHPDILPTIIEIESLYTGIGEDFCLTLSEFVELYCTDVELALHGEVIWPPHPPLNY